MGDKSTISWTNATWNPTVGCSIKSPGCIRCYAMRHAHRFDGTLEGPSKFDGTTEVVNGKPVWNGVVRLDEKALEIPLHWRQPRHIFVDSMSDLFHEKLSNEQIRRVIDVAVEAPQHTYQILTKRDERMRRWVDWYCRSTTGPLPGNVWLGVSVEDRARKTRIDELCATSAAVRFLSLEPLLEDLGTIDLLGIHWVIVGGESGPGARTCRLDWIRDIVAQCRAAGVPVFVKQLGADPRHELRATAIDTGYPVSDKKGGNIADFPEDLQVREFPR